MVEEKTFKFIPIAHRDHRDFDINMLMHAMATGQDDITPYLHMANKVPKYLDFNALIFLAKFKSNAENAEKYAKILLAAGANPQVGGGKSWDHALVYAARRKSKILKILIEHCPFEYNKAVYQCALNTAAQSSCPFADETCQLLLDTCNYNLDLQEPLRCVMHNNAPVSIKLLKLLVPKCKNPEYISKAMGSAISTKISYHCATSRLNNKLLYSIKFISVWYIDSDLIMNIFLCGYNKLFFKLLKRGAQFDRTNLLSYTMPKYRFKHLNLPETTIVRSIEPSPPRYYQHIELELCFREMYDFLVAHFSL